MRTSASDCASRCSNAALSSTTPRGLVVVFAVVGGLFRARARRYPGRGGQQGGHEQDTFSDRRARRSPAKDVGAATGRGHAVCETHCPGGIISRLDPQTTSRKRQRPAAAGPAPGPLDFALESSRRAAMQQRARFILRHAGLLALAAIGLGPACSQDGPLSDEEMACCAGSCCPPGRPADTSNVYGDDCEAARLGKLLFFETRFSGALGPYNVYRDERRARERGRGRARCRARPATIR